MSAMQQVWDQKSEAEREQFGDNTEGMARIAAGFYGEPMAAVARTANWITNSLLPEDVRGGNLDKDYADVTAEDWKEPQFQVGKLDNVEDRMKVLDQLTQNAAGGGLDANGRCSSTVLLAAAIHGGGDEGLKAMLAALEKGAHPDDPVAKSNYKMLAEKMKSGTLDQADLSLMNDELYMQLREKQAKMFEGHDIPMSGVDPSVMQEFIKSSPEMSKYFQDGKMSIDSVDTDGKDGANHFVLSVGGPTNGFVYDPQARKDGHQVVVNPVDVRNYHNKETKADRIDAADFGANPFDGLY